MSRLLPPVALILPLQVTRSKLTTSSPSSKPFIGFFFLAPRWSVTPISHLKTTLFLGIPHPSSPITSLHPLQILPLIFHRPETRPALPAAVQRAPQGLQVADSSPDLQAVEGILGNLAACRLAVGRACPLVGRSCLGSRKVGKAGRGACRDRWGLEDC